MGLRVGQKSAWVRWWFPTSAAVLFLLLGFGWIQPPGPSSGTLNAQVTKPAGTHSSGTPTTADTGTKPTVATTKPADANTKPSDNGTKPPDKGTTPSDTGTKPPDMGTK